MGREPLDDAAYGRRVRLQNRLRSERQRDRLIKAGKVAFTCWLPDTLRDRIVAAADAQGARINDVVAEALRAGLPTVEGLPIPAPDNPSPPAKKPSSGERAATTAALMQECEALINQGRAYADICRDWNAAGRKTYEGVVFRPSDLARAHRRWQQRTQQISPPNSGD